MIKDLNKFWQLTSPRQRRKLSLLIVLMALAAIMEMLGIGALLPIMALMERPELLDTNPILMHISALLGHPSRQNLFIGILAGFFAFFAVKNLFLVLLDAFQYRLLARETADISTRLIQSYLRRPYAFHLQINTSKLIRTVTTDVNTLLYYILIPGVVLTAEALVVAALFALIVFIDPKAALFSILLGGALLGLYFRVLRERVYRIGQEVQHNATKMIQYAQEGLGGIKEIKVMHRQPFFESAFSDHAARHAGALSRSLIIAKLPAHLLETAFVSLFVGVLVLLTVAGKLTEAFTLMAVYAAAAFRLIPSLNRIMTSANSIKQGAASLESIANELAKLEEGKKDVSGAPKLPFRQSIELENIFFRYLNSETDSIKGISLTIRRGEMVGFMGKSGGGKTTLIDIVLGLLKPDRGAVRVDGVSMEENLRSWQMNIGYIPQHIYLTDDSLKRNIALGLEERAIDTERVRAVIAAARLAEFVQTLPDGLETMVGERGVRLSGGQRQRIGIARALYYDPQVIVMDEGTSALDGETEADVITTINGMKHSKTILIIAHRLSTIEHCDRVFVLQDGNLIRSGRYEDVVGPSRSGSE